MQKNLHHFAIDPMPDPNAQDHDFRESKFFSELGLELPDPSEVDVCGVQGIAAFPDMNLLVKKGRYVSVDEAITTWAVQKVFGDDIPVPEIYGWRVRGEYVLIYMELVSGTTLLDRWDTMTSFEKATVCNDLRSMSVRIRQMPRLFPDAAPIGSITGGPLRDRMFDWTLRAGPFQSLRDFYSWMEWLPQRRLEQAQRYTDPFLQHLPAGSKAVFTHADLHPSNIMVSFASPPRVVAVIDWGQSGWYPDYWEYFKMIYTTHWDGDWRKNWIGEIVDERVDEALLMADYCQQIGAT